MTGKPGVPVEQGPAAGQAAAQDPDLRGERERACHRLLFRLAGRAPDDLLAGCREWLADGDVGDLARAVTFWAVSQDAALAEEDLVLLSELVAETGADADGLGQLQLDDSDPYPYYGFAPVIPADFESPGGAGEAGDQIAVVAKTDGQVEQAAVTAVEGVPGAIGMWRAWRFPSDGAPWPPPKRVFVVETRGGVGEPGVAVGLQRRLAAAGENDPQVEVYQTGCRLPMYQELARSCGELLWAAVKDPGIRIAAVFDEVDPDEGPRFRPDHARVPDDEASRVVSYLYSGEPLLVTTGRMDDVMDPARTYCVPMSFRTDGTWIWTEAAAYYVQQHRLEPDPGLLAHLRSNDYTVPEVDGVGVYRALRILQEPAEEAPYAG
jgi:hypothetical protein